MGCDGGTIPKRDELVRTKKKPEQADKDAENAAKWKHCALSQEELRQPIVACEIGRLYNKDSVIEYLLDKSQTSDIAKHIRNLKDVVELKLTENPAYKKDTINNGDEYMDHQKAPFICPVVGTEMNGKYKFFYLRGCGCVLSERAFKLVKSEMCHKCGKKYEEDDIIALNGTEDEVNQLRERMETRRQKMKLEKKAKKHKLDETSVAGPSSVSAETDSDPNNKKKIKTLMQVPKVGQQNQAKSDKSIAKDNTKSETYKSIFTSHKSYKHQPKAHWITYNPLYN